MKLDINKIVAVGNMSDGIESELIESYFNKSLYLYLDKVKLYYFLSTWVSNVEIS
jgi:hypothetical protein